MRRNFETEHPDWAKLDVGGRHIKASAMTIRCHTATENSAAGKSATKA